MISILICTIIVSPASHIPFELLFSGEHSYCFQIIQIILFTQEL